MKEAMKLNGESVNFSKYGKSFQEKLCMVILDDRGFADQIEEVLDIELTQYGKNLLTRGRFKPAFYAFFDDDIIYDSTYAGFTEIQNETEKRIQNDEKWRIHCKYC